MFNKKVTSHQEVLNKGGSPVSSADLSLNETRILVAMQRMGFVRFERVPIRNGELVLDPWPITIRDVKFGAEEPAARQTGSDEFALKRQVIEFFEYVRRVDAGEIRRLTARHGIPFSMEVTHEPDPGGVSHG